MVQPLWPGYYAHDRSPLRACRRLNHYFHLPGGELAIENMKEDERENNKDEKEERNFLCPSVSSVDFPKRKAI
jgi:hypothetical protein